MELIEDTVALHFEERNYLYYNFHTVLDEKGLSYDDYLKMVKAKSEQESKALINDIEDIKKENEDFLKSFFEKR